MTGDKGADRLSGLDERPYQLAALASHPIQYQAPLFRELAARNEIELAVYFCDRQGTEAKTDPGFGTEVAWDVLLLEGYDHVFLDKLSSFEDTNSFLGLLNPELVTKLREDQPDILCIHGYMSATNILAFVMALYVRNKYIEDCLERLGKVEEMGRVSKERIGKWGIEETADGMIRCVQTIVNGV